MAWEDDEWPDLPDDPEARERRRRAAEEGRRMSERAMRWGYAVLGILVVVVIVLALTR
jgi:hypothetical protein